MLFQMSVQVYVYFLLLAWLLILLMCSMLGLVLGLVIELQHVIVFEVVVVCIGVLFDL